MGNDSGENTSGEVTNGESGCEVTNGETTVEVTSEEVESAFDECSETSESHTIENRVSEKSEVTDLYMDEAEKPDHEASMIINEKTEINYERPTSYREGVRDQVWENAKDEHGRVRDPVSGRYMSKDQPWDMGHKPGYEFTKHQESARERQISRKEFLDEHNNPDHYRPELPKSNRSHKGESKTENYYL